MAGFANLVDLFEKSCEKYSSNELFGTKKSGSWSWITFAEFQQKVDAFRGGLASLGVSKGDRVGVISNNRVEWAVAAYATYGLGAAFVPMYEAQKPAEWEFILGDCGAKIAIGATNDIHEKLQALKAKLDCVEHTIGFELAPDHADSFEALCTKGKESIPDAVHPEPGDIAGFIYTSGTTGQPKGVKLSHNNICSNINAIHGIFTFEPTDRSLSFLPWAHSFGQTCELHGLLSMGASLAINDEIPSLLDNLREVKPSILFAVPRIFNRVYDGLNKQVAERPAYAQSIFHAGLAAAAKKNGGESLGIWEKIQLGLADKLVFSKVREKLGGQLRYAISGSAALNRDVAKFIDALGIEVYEGYGLTETSPIATANFPGNRKIGSVGKPITDVRIVIDKSVTGDERDGEILIYGPNVMLGYHNREKANQEVLMDDGGFRSGDMGRIDDEGFLFITGRIKEQYKLENGKYVVPSPLEEEIKLSSFIANVMIFGANKPHNVALVVPDMPSLEKWAATANVSLDGDLSGNETVVKFLMDEIASHSKSFKGYERPRAIAITTEDFTPENGMLTPTMKLKRRNVLKEHGDTLEGLYS